MKVHDYQRAVRGHRESANRETARRLQVPAVRHGDHSDLIAIPFHRERRAEIFPIEYVNGILIADKNDDRVISPEQRDPLETDRDLVAALTGEWGEAIALRSDCEAPHLVRGAKNTDHQMERL